ncbi:SusC/RagA family TonB-linked outer membrane protein [Parapedobacter koreensis]|nr:TonB-dependent receptor [Parapedobacter koreensis]
MKYTLLGLVCCLLFCQRTVAQETVTGKVTDAASGEPLVGATITVVGEDASTTTNEEGVYTLTVRSFDVSLLVRYIGYNSQEVALGGKKMLDIAMVASDSALEEVVVIGYGTQAKQDVTGSVSAVKGDEIVRSNAPNLANALVGRLPGIVAVQRNAEPGDDSPDELLIRGRSTLNNNAPLILVDGIPRDFSQIDPNEIESLSVLKDASATAVYGIRGANGVILVTTKRGKTGKPSFTYNGYAGIQNPSQVPKYLNSYDFARLYNEAALNDNPDATPPYSAEDLQKYRDHSSPYTHPDVDWYNAVIKPDALQQRHSLSSTGGSEHLNYFLLLGYFDQQGMYRSVNFSKYNFRANINADLSNTTKLTVGLGGELGDWRHPGVVTSREDGGIFSTTTYLPPNAFPIKNEDGSWASLWGTNPVADLTEAGYRKNGARNIQTSFTIDQKFDFWVKGLSAKVIYAYDFGFNNYKNWYTPYQTFIPTGDGLEEIGVPLPSLDEGFDQYNNRTFETHINYNRTFGKHELGILALYTQFASYSNSLSGYRSDFPSKALDQLFAGPRTNINNYGGASESGREGVVGRINYNYDQRYLVEASFGYNGSENFAPSRRYGFFPGFSLGWNMANEAFLKRIDYIDMLKIRGSYGEVGNDLVSDRRFLYRQPVYYGSDYVFGGSSPTPVQSLYIGELANPYVTWERARKTNFGVDASFKGGFFGFRTDVFFEQRANILAMRNQSVPVTFGASLPVENIARVRNHGVEVELRHDHTIGAFNYFVNANYTFTRNKIAFIDEPANIPAYRQRTGKPMGQFFGYVSEGLYQTQEEIDNSPKIVGVEPRLGDIRYKDLNGDNVINSNDISAIGKSDIPESIFGITLGGSYKGFDLNVLLQGAGGYNVNFQGEATLEFIYGSSAMEHHLDRWTPENPNASYPRLSLDQYNYKQETSSFWLQDAAYLRLKNAELGYTFPKSLIPENVLKRLRIYLTGTNLLTWSKVKIFDPEAPSGAPYFYPIQKTMMVGLNVEF